MRFALPLSVALALVPTAARPDDGDADPTFSDDGRTTVSLPGEAAGALAVAADGDGRLVIAGWTGLATNGDQNWLFARFEADGFRDFDFGVLGLREVAFDLGGNLRDTPFHVSLEPDGGVLGVGRAEHSATGASWPALVRLDAAGDLDPDFGDGGRLLIDQLPWSDPEAVAIAQEAARLPDGRILIGGRCRGCDAEDDNDLFLLRLEPDGDPDPTFGDGGWVTFEAAPEESDSFHALALDGLGRVVVAGSYLDGGGLGGLAFFRRAADGTADPTFGGGDGVVLHPVQLSSYPRALATDPVSHAIVAGFGFSGGTGTRGGVVRLTATGELDATFGVGGGVNLTLEEGSEIFDVALQSDGRIVAAGWIDANGAQTGGFFLARLTASGALDPTFDGNGVARYEFDLDSGALDQAFALTLAGGRPVAVGVAGLGGEPAACAVLRAQSALIFADGLERGTTGAWSGH